MMQRPILLAAALALGAGCSAYEASLDYNDDMGDTGWGGSESPDTDDWTDSDGGASETEDDLPPLSPAQTDVYVFIANPERDTLTRIHVQTMDVRTVSVGDDPRVVRTTADYQRAVVFNRGDDSLSVVDAESLDVRTIGVRDNYNQLVLSPDGAWAAAFHDRAAERPDDPPATGMQSYNEVSFVQLDTGRHVAMAVGYNPRAIQFTRGGELAVVVTDEYLALIDLTEAQPRPRMIQVAEDLLDPPVAEEVALSPGGEWAFVRQFGADSLTVVDLNAELVERIPVGVNPTDLDLTPDGSTAIVVSRGARELWLFDTSDPINVAPEVLGLPGDDPLGSLLLDPSGEQALIYTTASAVSRYATWDLNSNDITLRSLVKPVRSMSITPTGTSALVFHTQTDAADADPNSPFRGKWALTMIDLADHRTNPLRLPAEPIGFSNSDDGRLGYFIMDNQPLLEVLDYSSLLYNEYDLRSDPVFVGVLPDLDPADGIEPRAWVSQEHPLGRISLFDPADASMETITGFELNSQIED